MPTEDIGKDWIQLKYNDAEHAQIINGALHIDIGFNTIIEQKPFAYQNINGKKTEVKCSYVFKNNILSFENSAIMRFFISSSTGDM